MDVDIKDPSGDTTYEEVSKSELVKIINEVSSSAVGCVDEKVMIIVRDRLKTRGYAMNTLSAKQIHEKVPSWMRNSGAQMLRFIMYLTDLHSGWEFQKTPTLETVIISGFPNTTPMREVFSLLREGPQLEKDTRHPTRMQRGDVQVQTKEAAHLLKYLEAFGTLGSFEVRGSRPKRYSIALADRKKVVLQDVPENIDLDDMLELYLSNLPCLGIKRFSQGSTGKPSRTVCIKFETEEEARELLKRKRIRIGHLTCRVATYKSRNKHFCRKCKTPAPKHSSQNCPVGLRCARCSEPHRSKECPAESVLKCPNCPEATIQHSAYKCPKVYNATKKRNQQKRKQTYAEAVREQRAASNEPEEEDPWDKQLRDNPNREEKREENSAEMESRIMKEVMNQFKTIIPFIMSTTIAVLTEAGVISQEKAPLAQRIVDQALPEMLESELPEYQEPPEHNIQAHKELLEKNSKAETELKKRKKNEAAVAASFQPPELAMHAKISCPNCDIVIRKGGMKAHHMSAKCQKQAQRNRQKAKQQKLGFLKSNSLN